MMEQAQPPCHIRSLRPQRHPHQPQLLLLHQLCIRLACAGTGSVSAKSGIVRAKEGTMRFDQDETLFVLSFFDSIGVWGYRIHDHLHHSSFLALASALG